jgi:hypothetical protein
MMDVRSILIGVVWGIGGWKGVYMWIEEVGWWCES